MLRWQELKILRQRMTDIGNAERWRNFTIQLDGNWKFYDRNSAKLKVRDVGIFMVEFVITREKMMGEEKKKKNIGFRDTL